MLSINLCADQMVLLLAQSQQILALSSLSREKSGSYFHQRAMAYPQVDPVAEDILKYAPDIVLTGPYTSRYTLSLLDELGVQVESLSIANSIEDVLFNIKIVGALLAQSARAAEIAEHIRLTLSQYSDQVSALLQKSNHRPRAAVFDANGYTVGAESIRGEAMRLAGWHNVAEERGITSYGVLDLEDLIRLQPDALIESPYSEDTYSRGQRLTQHPALRATGIDPLIIRIPSNQTICEGPWTLDVIGELVNAHAQHSLTIN